MPDRRTPFRASLAALGCLAILAAGPMTARAETLPEPPLPLLAVAPGLELPTYVFGVRKTNGSNDIRGFVEMQGRPLILALWATWCGVCAKELPRLDAVQAEIGEEMPVIALAIDHGGLDKPAAYLSKRGLDNLTAYHDTERVTFVTLGAFGVPTIYIANAQGQIIARANGPVDWAGAEAREYLRAVIEQGKRAKAKGTVAGSESHRASPPSD